jgi:hypothetical protein
MSKLPFLKRANHFGAVLSTLESSPWTEHMFGASTELVKKKVSEMFIFFNLTLHSFGPEDFVPLLQIEELKKKPFRKEN